MVSTSHIPDVPAGTQGEGQSRTPLVPLWLSRPSRALFPDPAGERVNADRCFYMSLMPPPCKSLISVIYHHVVVVIVIMYFYIPKLQFPEIENRLKTPLGS